MSQSEQAPAAASPFGDIKADKHNGHPPSLPNAGLSLTTPQGQAVFESYTFNESVQGGYDGLPGRHSADLADLEYLEICPTQFPSLGYNLFQDTTRLGQVKQIFLGYLTELNLAHDAYQALHRNTTCSGTSSRGFEVMMVPAGPLPRLSIEELFHLSHRFTSTLHMMSSAGMFTAQHVDPALLLLVYSRMQDVHYLALQLVSKSLQLSKHAMTRIITQSNADELPPSV